MIYVCFILPFVIFSFLDLAEQKETLMLRKTCIAFLFIAAIFFIGFRYYTGSDWSAYLKYFDAVDWKNKTYGSGYKTFTIVSKAIVPSYYFEQFLATSAFTYSIFRLYKKYASRSVLCIFIAVSLYFGSLFMCQVRQSLALAVTLLGTDYLLENKILKYIMCVAIACLFHVTAIFALVCILLRVKASKWLRLLFVALGLVLILFPNLTISFLLFASNIITDGVYHKLLAGYLSSQKFGGGATLSLGLFFFARIFLAFFIVLFYSPKTQLDNFLINALVMSAVITSAAFGFGQLGRLEYYVGFYAIIGYTYLLEIPFLKKNKGVFFMFFMILIALFFFPFCKGRTSHGISKITGRDTQYQYLPYYNFFLHPQDAWRKDWGE